MGIDYGGVFRNRLCATGALVTIFEALFFLRVFSRMGTSDPFHDCFCVLLHARHCKRQFIDINEGKILAHSSLKNLVLVSQYISTSFHLQAITLIYGRVLMNQTCTSFMDIICKVLMEKNGIYEFLITLKKYRDHWLGR